MTDARVRAISAPRERRDRLAFELQALARPCPVLDGRLPPLLESGVASGLRGLGLARLRTGAAQLHQLALKIDEAVPVTVNDPPPTLPAPERVGGAGGSKMTQRVMVAEDSSCLRQQVPGMFHFIGITPNDQAMAQAASSHSPRFCIDESGLMQGALAVDFLLQ